ncbi:MAG TPA: sulfatase [Natronoarchaeum rubrum]|nr:sulfatase [Natronoarchaeum rubrum]
MKTVLLTVDALRADHLSQYGYERETMPVVDRIAAEGTRFEAAFANGTNTGVSLPSLLSSRYFGVEDARTGPNVATAIDESGATTAGFHSNALFSNRVGDVAGFDRYEDFGVADEQEEANTSSGVELAYDRVVDTLRPIVERLGVRDYAELVQERLFPTSLIHELSVYVDAETLTDEVLAWTEDHADEDFFLWVHYMDPHRPYGIDPADPAFADPIGDDEIRDLMSRAGISPETITDEDRELMIDLYDSDLRYTSDQIDRLLDGFEELGIWDETGLVFTADHGEEFDEHGHYFHRNRPYDELLHVPLVVVDPVRSGDADASAQRELLDVAPTLCEWHGVDVPEQFGGTPLFDGDGREVIATGSFVEQGHVVAGRWDGWKYIHVEDGETELFDLDADPGETNDVAAVHPDTVESFERAIPNPLFEGEPVSVDAAEGELQDRLADLGYLE